MAESTIDVHTLIEKVKTRMREETFLMLLGDDEELDKVLRGVVHEALIQPQRVPNGPYNYTYRDSPVVEAVRDAAKGLAKTLVEELIADPAIKQQLLNALVLALPAAMRETWQDSYSRLLEDAVNTLKIELAARI